MHLPGNNYYNAGLSKVKFQYIQAFKQLLRQVFKQLLRQIFNRYFKQVFQTGVLEGSIVFNMYKTLFKARQESNLAIKI